MIRQYVGARYVPKYYANSQNPETSEWEKNTEYEALTVVTYNGQNFISKRPIPKDITSPINNPYYWEKFQVDSNVIPTAIYAEANSDITSKLNDALGDGDVVLFGGPYLISHTINVPSFHRLYGNGCELKCSNFSDEWAITCGIVNQKTVNYPSTRITELNIDCGNYCSGINIIQQASTVDHIAIKAPKTCGIAVYYNGDSVPGDCNIDNIFITGNAKNGTSPIHKYGIYVNGTDNYIENIRTLGSQNGVFLANGYSTTLNNVHVLAYNPDDGDWQNTIGFAVNCNVFIYNCYADNYANGIYVNGEGTINGDGFFAYWYSNALPIKPTVIHYESPTKIEFNLQNITFDETKARGLIFTHSIILPINAHSSFKIPKTIDLNDAGMLTIFNGCNNYAQYSETPTKVIGILPNKNIINTNNAKFTVRANSLLIKDIVVTNIVDDFNIWSTPKAYYNHRTLSSAPTFNIGYYKDNNNNSYVILDGYDFGATFTYVEGCAFVLPTGYTIDVSQLTLLGTKIQVTAE